MVLVLDTRFLIDHTFPPTRGDRDALKRFLARTGEEGFAIPTVVMVEYLRVAGARIGGDAAATRLRLWAAGAEVVPLSEKIALLAGRMLLRHRVPVADAIVAATAVVLGAKVVSDDPHYKVLGVRTVWYKA